MSRGAGRIGRGVLALTLLALALLLPQGMLINGANAAPASGGTLIAWGSNGGTLGDGTLMQRDEPVQVSGTGSGGLSFIQIDGGISHSLGLTADGTAYAWGSNQFGQLNSAAGGLSTTPVKIPGTGPGGHVFTSIAAGNFFSLGVTADGTAYGWGNNGRGQLGDGTTGSSASAMVKVSGTGPGGIVLVALAAGAYHSLGLTANGTAYAWGDSEYGQLGNGVSGSGSQSTTPVQVSGTGPGGHVLTSIAAGNIHSLGLIANGTAYAWGHNDFGQLGDTTQTLRTTPVSVAGTGTGGVALTAISAGIYHSVGLTANGTAYAWGRNYEGELGDGTSGTGSIKKAPQLVPGTGPGGLVFTALATGGYFSLALIADGTAYSWGSNVVGELGNGTSGAATNNPTPAKVHGTGPTGIVLATVVGGGFHSIASAATAATNCAGFTDVSVNDPACPAIATLTEQGTIKGYAGVPPRFGPTDNVQRAQVATFLVRALAWQARPTGPRTFTDLAGLATELRTASLIVANTCDNNGLCVAYGYGDGRFGPTDPVSHAQVITFITRAFRLDPVQTWVPQPGDPQPYTGVPTVHDTDVRTFVHYAGPIPSAPSTAAGWNAPASRAWVAMLLYQALTVQP